MNLKAPATNEGEAKANKNITRHKTGLRRTNATNESINL